MYTCTYITARCVIGTIQPVESTSRNFLFNSSNYYSFFFFTPSTVNMDSVRLRDEF